MVSFAQYQASDDPEHQNLVMHAQLQTTAGFTLMLADTPTSAEFTVGNAISASISGGADDERPPPVGRRALADQF